MLHTLTADRAALHAHFVPGAVPVLTIDPGHSVLFRAIPDVSWGLEPPTSTTAPRRKVEPRDPARDNGPCLCGPVAVRSAAPGDTLRITLEHIRPGPWGWTYAGKGMPAAALNAALGLAETPLTLLRWSLDAERQLAHDQHGHVVPARAFPGTIGLSPPPDPAAPDAPASGWVPRTCGGNMDCRELVAGSILELPVMVDGALLSIGDGHAAQADGELSGTAIECMLEEARLRIDLVKDRTISAPRIQPPDPSIRAITLGFGESLELAAHDAAAEMLTLIQESLELSRVDALALASSQVDLRITQMVNPRRGVHAVWRR